MRRIFLILGVLLLLVSTVLADSIKDIKTIVDDAANYLASGKSVDVFNDPGNSRFVKPPLYVFVYECKDDSNIILAAHPFVHKLVGKNIARLKDKKGKFFVVDLCQQVKKHPSGVWVEYYWFNPKTKKIEKKYTFMKQVKGKPYQVGAGLYKSQVGNLTIDELNKK